MSRLVLGVFSLFAILSTASFASYLDTSSTPVAMTSVANYQDSSVTNNGLKFGVFPQWHGQATELSPMAEEGGNGELHLKDSNHRLWSDLAWIDTTVIPTAQMSCLSSFVGELNSRLQRENDWSDRKTKPYMIQRLKEVRVSEIQILFKFSVKTHFDRGEANAYGDEFAKVGTKDDGSKYVQFLVNDFYIGETHGSYGKTYGCFHLEGDDITDFLRDNVLKENPWYR